MAKAAEEAVEELPRVIVRRMVKEQLTQCSKGEDMAVNKDALLAFSESARIFIHYLTATAHAIVALMGTNCLGADDICKESKRQTINAEDVFKALEEIEFSEFVEPLKIALDEFKQKNAAKKSATKEDEPGKKRKAANKDSQQNSRKKADEN